MILTSLARAIAAAAVLLAALPARADTPTITIAALKFGTVNWELDTIRAHGLDAANGFALVVKGMAGGPASNIVSQTGSGSRASGPRGAILCSCPIPRPSAR
jgi:NitT/TauT family transport system substrate-binding protein